MSDTATMTVRLPATLLTTLDREAERRSQLAGGPGLISRNAMLRLAVEAGLQALTAPSWTAEPVQLQRGANDSATPAESPVVSPGGQIPPRERVRESAPAPNPGLVSPPKAKAPKLKAKPMGAAHTFPSETELREQVRATGLSQRAFAKRAKIAQSRLNQWLKGGNLSSESLEKVARALEGRG